MAQNENISLSLANKVDILNKSQSVDARYGVYDTESDALDAMLAYGADGRQVAVYTNKASGKTVVKVYNEVLHQLEPLDPEVYELIAEGAGVTLLDNEDGTFSLISSDSTVLSTIDKSSLIDNTDGTFTFNNTGKPEDDVILDFNASSLPYNNTTSQLSATDVQDAIDEVVSNVASGAGIELIDNEDGTFSIVSEDETVLATINKANLTDNEDGTYTFNNTGDPSDDILLDFNASSLPYNNTESGLTANNTQDAIDELTGTELTFTGTTNQVTVTGGTQDLSENRTWTFSLPQNIHTGASPTFSNLTLASQLNVGNLRFSGNSIQSTDSNGNINISPNGTGKLVYNSLAGSGTETNALFKNANNEIVQRTLGTGAFANIGDYVTTSAANSTYEVKSAKGVANGYAPLNSNGKVPSMYLDISGADYKGTWDASTNTPTIADGVGTNGDWYRVSVAGTQDLGSGNITFELGDDARYNGSVWERVPSGQSVVSVNGYTGAVVVEADDIPYSNTTSGMTSTIVQDAIDELRGLDLNDFTNTTLNRYVRLDESLVKLEENMTFTVGVGKDFETIEEAIDQALNYYPNEDYKITILIDEGYEVTETLYYQGLDFSHIIFSSTGFISANIEDTFENEYVVFFFRSCWLPSFDNFYITGTSEIPTGRRFSAIYTSSSSSGYIKASHFKKFNNVLWFEQTSNFYIENTKIQPTRTQPLNLFRIGIRLQNSWVDIRSVEIDTDEDDVYYNNPNNVAIEVLTQSKLHIRQQGGTTSILGNFTNLANINQGGTLSISTVTELSCTGPYDINVVYGMFFNAIPNSPVGNNLRVNIPYNVITNNGIALRRFNTTPYNFNGTDYILDYIKAPSGQEYNVTVDDDGKLSSEPKPTIPAQVNLIEGSNISITGTYPNLTISASGTVGTNWEDIGGDQSDVNISGFTNDAGYTTNTGTVTSVGLSVPTGLQVSGSPITSSGTLAITYSSGYQGYTTAESDKLANEVIEKSSEQWNDIELDGVGGDPILINIDTEARFLNITDNTTSSSLGGYTDDGGSIPTSIFWSGMTVKVHNATASDQIIKYNYSSATIKFLFPKEEDYIIKPNETITFTYRGGALEFEGIYLTDENISFDVSVTKSELDNLIANEELIPNALYEITGVNPDLYGGTTIYLQAVSATELNPRGVGKFYNPKYDKDVNGFGIVKDYVWWTIPTNQKESGEYAVNDVVIWGGKHWVCIQETDITTKYIIDDFELDTDYFEVIPFNDTDYNIAYDEIVYDYQNDWIIERNEANSNIVSFSYDWLVYFSDYWLSGNIVYDNPIRSFQWGNVFDSDSSKGIGFQKITKSLNRNINFRGAYQINLTFDSSSQYNLTFDNNSSQYNLTFDNNSSQNNLTFDSSSQYNLTFDSSSQSNLTFDNNSSQYNLTFDNNSSQNNLTFDNNSSQYNLTFDNNSSQYNLTFDNNSSQNNLTFDNNSSQSNLTFDNNSYQYNLTFDNNSYQYNLTLNNKNQTFVNFKNYRVDYSRLSNTPLINSLFTENNYLRSVSQNIESIVYSEEIVSNTSNSVTTNSETIYVDFLLYNNIETTKNQILLSSQRNATGATTGTVYLNDVSVGTFSLTTTSTARTINLPTPVTLRGLNKIRIEFSGGSGGETTITNLRFNSSNETQYGDVDYQYTEFVGGVLSKEEPNFLVGRAGNKEITVPVDDFAKNSDLAEVAFSGDSKDVFFDNTQSGLDATNVQDAIDEISDKISVLDEVTNINIFNQYTESTVSGDAGTNLIHPDLGLPILEVEDIQEDSSYSGELVLNIENNNTATAKVIELFGAEIYNNTNPSADITAKITFAIDFFNQVGDDIDYKLSWEYLSSGEILFGEHVGTIDNTSNVDFELLVTGHSTDSFNLKKARLWRN